MPENNSALKVLDLFSGIASAASPSDLNGPECEPSRSARSTPIAGVSSLGTGQMSLFSETCEALPLNASPQMELSLTSSAEAFPAKISVSQARESAWQVPEADYGSSTPDLLANFDPNSSSWRTSQACLVEGWTLFSESWPRSGTMQNGIAYRLPPLVPLTGEIGSGLLPTPRPNKVGGVSPPGYRPTLEQAVREVFPTPSATDFKSELMSLELVQKRKDASARGVRLTEFLHRKNLPTPNAGSSHWGGRLDEYGGSTNPFRGTEIGQSRLNPCWVEELMGYQIGYTDLKLSETPSSRKSRKSSDGQS